MKVSIQTISGKRFLVELPAVLQASQHAFTCSPTACIPVHASQKTASEMVCGSMHAYAHFMQAGELKAQVARVTGLPVDKLKVIYRGTTLVASDARVPLSDGGDT